MDKKIYDVLILGAGPAGLAAGLYAARSKMSVLIVEKGMDGGQIALAHDIENYPGQANIDGERGMELTGRMSAQCWKYGCERAYDTVMSVDLSGRVKKLIGAQDEYLGYSVIICTGAMTRSIGCNNEEKYIGKGVSYCAVCDANFFNGLEVFVAGGNGIAAEEALYLSKYARKLTVLCKGSRMAVTEDMEQRLNEAENISVLTDTEVTDLGEDELLSRITVKNVKTGEETVFRADEKDGFFGLFAFTGKKTTAMFDGILPLEGGYIPTNEKMETGVPGVYAAGDVRVTPLRQVVTACSDGAVAAMQCERYVSRIKKEM